MKKNCMVKIITVAAVTTFMMGVCTGCGSEAAQSNEASVEEAAVEDATVEEAAVEEATVEEAVVEEVAVEEAAVDENPGAFETEDFSISYDTEKWYGMVDENSVVFLNCLEAVAGTSYIEISKSEFATPEEAIENIAKTKGQDLVEATQFEMNGYNTYSTWNNIPQDATGPVLDDFYLVFEKDGKVIVVDECITRDSDSSRAEALSYVFSDVIDTLKIK